MKVLINCCYGGFNLSQAFEEELDKRHTNRNWTHYGDPDCRSDPAVIALAEEWEASGRRFWGDHSLISVEEIPDDVEFTIVEYDGAERLHWELPTVTIIQDLLDIAKGRKKEAETSKFTQILLKEDCDMVTLRKIVNASWQDRV